MFDDEIQTPELNRKNTNSAPFNWASLPLELLIQYRDEITRHLPPLTLKDLNLEEEMLLQFHALRALQNGVLNDEEFPLNQRAQVANSVASSLGRLAELQESLYSSERFKMIENLLIRTLNVLGEEVAGEFLSEYRTKVLKISQN